MHPSDARTPNEKAAIAISACSVAWVVGAAMFHETGGVNSAGLVPAVGCLVALSGAVRSDAKVMWFGTGVVLVSAVALLFSVGLAVAPAGVVLALASVLLSRTSRINA